MSEHSSELNDENINVKNINQNLVEVIYFNHHDKNNSSIFTSLGHIHIGELSNVEKYKLVKNPNNKLSPTYKKDDLLLIELTDMVTSGDYVAVTSKRGFFVFKAKIDSSNHILVSHINNENYIPLKAKYNIVGKVIGLYDLTHHRVIVRSQHRHSNYFSPLFSGIQEDEADPVETLQHELHYPKIIFNQEEPTTAPNGYVEVPVIRSSGVNSDGKTIYNQIGTQLMQKRQDNKLYYYVKIASPKYAPVLLPNTTVLVEVTDTFNSGDIVLMSIHKKGDFIFRYEISHDKIMLRSIVNNKVVYEFHKDLSKVSFWGILVGTVQESREK